jgi:3-hydroxyisobutyrate dehydrogenase-like beta-hydroxyacid dehydrogenase
LGFVGLGIMGKGMARNLLSKANASLVVWNRSPAACQELSDAFPGKVTIANTAKEVVERCEITFSMLSDMAASEAVYDAPDIGMLHGVSGGKVIVDASTISAERMMEVFSKVESKGGLFLEAPVSGSKVSS